MRKQLLFLATAFYFCSATAQFSGNALDFDGANDMVEVSTVPAVFSTPSSSDFTIEAWVNPRGSAFARIFFAQPSTTNFVSLGTNTGNTIYFYVIKNGTTVSVATTAGIPQNQWTHVAARWTAASSTAEVFFNGVLQATGSGGSSSSGTSGILAIGARTGGSQYFNGQIDELRVWSSALTTCQIQSNFNRTLPSPLPSLLMNYNFNQGTAAGTNSTVNSLADISGASYTGTLTNFALSGTTSNWVASTASVAASGYTTTSVSAVSSQTNITCNGAADGIASVTASGIGPYTYTWMPGGATTATVGSLSSGIYTVSVANACGLITRTINITQPSPISLSLTASSASVCAGNSATLTANGSGGTGSLTYSWTGSSASSTAVVSPTATMVYTLNASDANSCAKSGTIAVAVNAIPTVSLSAVANTVCVSNGTMALSGTPSGGVYSGTNVSGAAFTTSVSGTFTPLYSYTDPGTGCSNTATTIIVVNACTGVAVTDPAEAMPVSVYPNPGTGNFSISLYEPAFVSVTDLFGKIILSAKQLDAGSHPIDLSHEAEGMYVIRVQTKSGFAQLKVMKY